MSDNLFDHQKESILIDEKMEKVSLLDSTCNLLLDNEEDQHLQKETNTAVPVNDGELKEADVVRNDVAFIGNTTNDNRSTEKEENDDSSSEEDDDSSSSSDSDSSSSSGDEDEDESSSSSSDEEVDDEAEEGEITGGGDEFIFSSDGEETVEPKGPIKSKHEIEDYPPVPPITASLEPHHQTLPVGVVLSIMGNKVIVEGSEKHTPLNEGSILWITETRLPLGIVDEIFGPVKNPYYIVRYNSESEVPQGVRSGIPVSFVADFANHIINDKSLYQKGYDASGADDEEVDLDLEFSDDEKEAEYRRSLRQSKWDKNHKEGSNSLGFNKKKNNSKGNGHFGNFNVPKPALNNVGESSKATSSTTYPTQHSNGTPSLGLPPQQFTSGPLGFPPRPHNMGMPGGGYPMMQNWMSDQQQNQNFGMMQQQQQQILTNALLGLIGPADIATVDLIVNLLHWCFPSFDYRWLIDEIRENAPKELDFLYEASNNEKCLENFKKLSPHIADSIYAPKVYWDMSTSKLLTMEYMDAAEITDVDAIRKFGIRPHEVSKLVSEAFAEMIFKHGFVHCDPHAANMMVRPMPSSKWNIFGKPKPQLVLLDHGLYRVLDFETRTNYAALWKGLVFANVKAIKEYSVKLGAGEDLYALFAGILTMRPWSKVSNPSVDHLVIEGTNDDRSELQTYASQYFPEITELLRRLPRVILLLLKTNDCLRAVNNTLLQGPFIDGIFITGRVASEVVAETRYMTQKKKSLFSGLSLWSEKKLLELRFFCMKIIFLLLQTRKALTG